MKNKLILFILVCFTYLGISLADSIPVNTVSSKYNSCNPAESSDINYYLTGQMVRYPQDKYRNTATDAYISAGESHIDIWKHGIIGTCNWDLISNVVVQGKTGIVFRSNGGCTFNIPTNYTKTNSTQIDAQIHSVIGFHEKAPALARGATTHNARYYWTNNRTVWTCYPNGETGTNPSVCQPKNFRYYDELDTHEGECLNYRIFWCGDGLLNGYNGGTSYNNIDGTLVEQCDPNLPSSIPSGKRCNTTTCILEDITPTEYCGDGIINQASEDCDPGSSNFGNGCNSNCKLMTPSCTFTVNPNQGYIPLTTTISGTTNARWGRIVYLYFGDGQSTGNGWDGIPGRNNSNHSFQLSHTYNTVGMFHLTGVVKNVYAGQIRTGVVRPTANCTATVQTTTPPTPDPECSSTYNGQYQYTNYSTNWLNQNMPLCTNGDVTGFSFSWTTGHSRHFNWGCTNGTQTITGCHANQYWCGDGKVSTGYGEACDPNDTGHYGRGNSGCSASCQPVNQGPQCNSQYNGQTQYTNYSTNWLNQNMPLCSIGTIGNFSYSGTPRHFTWTCNVTGYTPAYCSANQEWCGDGLVNGNEACDPNDPTHAGWNGNGYSCNSSCQLVPPPTPNPQCNTAYSGTHYVNSPAYPNWLTESMNLCSVGTVTPNSLTHRWNGVGHVGHYSWTCSNSTGSITCQANQQWCGDGLVNGNEACDPNDSTHSGWNNNGYTCNTSCQLVPPPGEPVPYLLKQQKTGGMANFTTNTINVEIGDIITYKVSFGNSGNVAATGQVKDVLPPCVKYVSSSIHLPSGVTYTGPLTGQQGVQDVVIYKNFKLNPGKGGYMLVTAEIKGNGVVGVNCSNVTGYLNTGYFKFDGGNRLTSDVLAVRPQVSGLIIQKEVLTAGVIHPGDTVNYKITLTNPGNATYHNAYILDSLPPSLEYQTSNIQGVSDYLFTGWASSTGRYNIKYYNFNVNPNQTVVVYLTAILKENFNVNEITNCSATSGAISCVGLTVPYIKKWQQLGNTTNVNGNWTTEILNVNPGSFISYRVDFGNFGNTGVYGEVKDILPECVTYVRSSLVGVSGTPVYNTGSHTVTATNLYLAPRVMGHLMVVGKVTTGGNCSSVYSYLNTGAFHFVGEERDYSEVEAVRPNATDVRITKEVSPTGPVQSGQLLTYTINYENKGPETLWTYTIVDYWPSDKLDYSGVVLANPMYDSFEQVSENLLKWYFTTPLPVNGTGQIVIQGTVR